MEQVILMANFQYLDSTGTIVADTDDVLLEVQNEYKQAFGQDLVVTPDTPQGVLITAETLARDNVLNNNAALANMINPNISVGVFLDAIMALTGMQRTVATQTVVSNVTLTGSVGTVIPIGSQAKTNTNIYFSTLSVAVIGADGTALTNFASDDFGPIACGAGELTNIVTNILGWETVNNTSAGVLGINTQSDIGARSLRNNTLGFQGQALPVAIISSLYNVTGVISLWFQENVAATTQTINDISMVSHSYYMCVDGGSDLDVASSLLENKSSGAAWNGSTTVSVIEPASGQTYSVSFDRPTEIEILVRVTTTNGNANDIKSAVMAYVTGQISGESGWQVGTDVSPWELAGAISTLYPATFIKKVEVALVSDGIYTTDVIAIVVNQVARTSLTNISVVISS